MQDVLKINKTTGKARITLIIEHRNLYLLLPKAKQCLCIPAMALSSATIANLMSHRSEQAASIIRQEMSSLETTTWTSRRYEHSKC